MNCPSCGAEMTSPTLAARLGGEVAVDVCPACQVIWFDHFESLKLSPGATLQLFRMIGERSQKAPEPIRQPLKCPRCDIRLLLTNDRQRNTPFRYWRCGRDHGRLITFFDFLREKDFIKPLSPQQLADVRAHVQSINCSNCGAPVDVARESACAHCGSPLSMIDAAQIEHLTAQLQADDAAAKTIDPALPGKLALEKLAVDTLFRHLREDEGWKSSSPLGLVEAGLSFLARKLS
jgi:hypothetical protein